MGTIAQQNNTNKPDVDLTVEFNDEDGTIISVRGETWSDEDSSEVCDLMFTTNEAAEAFFAQVAEAKAKYQEFKAAGGTLSLPD